MSGPSTAGSKPDQIELWLKLLRRVTQEYPGWWMWGVASSPFTGRGDVDSFAPPSDWPALQNVFREWVRDNGMGPAIICRHVPQGPHFVTLHPQFDHLFQFDVKDRVTLRGATLLDYRGVDRLAEMDEQGFRRIRHGAAAVLMLLYNGMHKGGEKDAEGLEKKNIVELMRSDPEGTRRATELTGWARKSLVRGIDAVLSGGWDREAMRKVERWAHLKSLTEPGVAISRVRFNRGPLQTCPVLRIIRRHGRVIPEDREAWLREVASGHVVYLDRPGEPLSEKPHEW